VQKQLKSSLLGTGAAQNGGKNNYALDDDDDDGDDLVFALNRDATA
jgi:hypothetical protein